jgi:hypothetical protein
MRGALLALAMLAMVAPGIVGADTVAHPERFAASAWHDISDMAAFARGAYDVVPDLQTRMKECVADLASAACVATR